MKGQAEQMFSELNRGDPPPLGHPIPIRLPGLCVLRRFARRLGVLPVSQQRQQSGFVVPLFCSFVDQSLSRRKCSRDQSTSGPIILPRSAIVRPTD